MKSRFYGKKMAAAANLSGVKRHLCRPMSLLRRFALKQQMLTVTVEETLLNFPLRNRGIAAKAKLLREADARVYVATEVALRYFLRRPYKFFIVYFNLQRHR
jgi:hypothetical protein